MLDEQPVEQCCARATDMQIAGRGRCESKTMHGTRGAGCGTWDECCDSARGAGARAISACDSKSTCFERQREAILLLREKSPAKRGFFTEKEGFEPSIRVSPYAGLANRCLKPLGHLSQRTTAEGHANVGSAQPAERAI